jgi:ATP/maltotriose-dependent transcriptional regulator MalT
MGDGEASRQLSDKAREITRSVEARFISDFADLVIAVNLADQSAIGAADALLSRVLDEEMLDPALLALRASPLFLKHLWESRSTRGQVAEIITRGNDRHLGALVGLNLGTTSERLARLTPREREVLELLCRGLSNREIAGTLVVEQSTVKVHLHHLYEKLGVKSRLQAILVAQTEGIESQGS